MLISVDIYFVSASTAVPSVTNSSGSSFIVTLSTIPVFVTINVVAEYERLGNYEFDVSIDDSSRILVKEAGSVSLSFNILSSNSFVAFSS